MFRQLASHIQAMKFIWEATTERRATVLTQTVTSLQSVPVQSFCHQFQSIFANLASHVAYTYNK